MRDTFVRTLISIAKADSNVILITGDLGFGVLKPYWEALPGQFINAGIAEQNMVGVAAGMALEGKIVFVYSIGNFPTMRCLEQIRNDCAYHQANVKIVCVGGGFVYGPLGMSHHATEDLAILRALPDVCVLAPGDRAEAEASTRAVYHQPGTCYLRLGRGGEPLIHRQLPGFTVGRAINVRKGKKVVLVSTGGILSEAVEACKKLEEHGMTPALISMPSVKPFDEAAAMECAREYELIVTVEEHNIIGGLGSAVAEAISQVKGAHADLLRIGLHDVYSSVVGSQSFLRGYYGMDAKAIADKTLAWLNG